MQLKFGEYILWHSLPCGSCLNTCIYIWSLLWSLQYLTGLRSLARYVLYAVFGSVRFALSSGLLHDLYYVKLMDCVILFIGTNMVLSKYAKLRILTLWRENKGPTVIVQILVDEGIYTTQKSVSLFIGRYVSYATCMTDNVGIRGSR